MKDKFFLDTNVFIYLFDDASPVKKQKSKELIQEGLDEYHAFISYQVVQEFINVSTKKFENPLSPDDCKLFLNSVMMPLWRVFPSEELFNSAIDISGRYQYSFYDSLIIAAAVELNATILYSEDLQHGQKIDELTIINPFK